eukprot:917109-Rhodomonas_salina.1
MRVLFEALHQSTDEFQCCYQAVAGLYQVSARFCLQRCVVLTAHICIRWRAVLTARMARPGDARQLHLLRGEAGDQAEQGASTVQPRRCLAEDFMDLQLAVQGLPTLEDALKAYITPE